MIARVSGQGQWRIPESLLPRLNELDEQAAAAVSAGDQTGLSRALEGLAEAVAGGGQRLADDELLPSDIVIPAPDTTIAEAADLFTEDGLVPG